MRNPMMIMKHEFIKKWTLALKTCCKNSSKYRSVMERQKAIKQTAAIAIAAAKRGSTAWSRAILVDEYHQKNSDTIIKAVMGSLNPVKSKHIYINTAYPVSSISNKRKVNRSPSMRSRRTRRSMSMNQKTQKARSMAKSIIKKQTQVLKRLVPGGETMDECCLIGEALDYIVSLKTEVDVMKELVIAAEYMQKPIA